MGGDGEDKLRRRRSRAHDARVHEMDPSLGSDSCTVRGPSPLTSRRQPQQGLSNGLYQHAQAGGGGDTVNLSVNKLEVGVEGRKKKKTLQE